ncbi:MAG TPA: hypothetical protein VEA99_18875 [Gemmatimonadaceae bacterium]|nr:hypothetical protein [Gemmatimonadaceae bacterium]
MPVSLRSRNVALLVAAVAIVAAIALVVTRWAGNRSGAGQPAAAAGPSVQPVNSPVRDALGATARTALDKGNVEFRAGRFEASLALYREAAAAAPQSAAPYFGIYMAARKLGNAALADSAQQEIGKRSGTASRMFSDSAMKAAHETRTSPH